MRHGPLAWRVTGTSHWQTPCIEHSGIVWTDCLYIHARVKWRNQIHNLCEETEFTTYVLDCAHLWNCLWDRKSFSSESSWNFSWRRWHKPISIRNSSTKTCCARTVKLVFKWHWEEACVDSLRSLDDTLFLLLLCMSVAGIFTLLPWRFWNLLNFGKDFSI